MAGEAPASRSTRLDMATVLALIGEQVELRFALPTEAFADRVLELGARAGDRSQALEVRLRCLSLDDLYLATACATGEEKAWEECAERYFGFIRSMARRYLPSADAADVADQVIADLWQRRRIGRYEGRSRLRTWLGAVVAHAALNVLKARRSAVQPDAGQLRSSRQRYPETAAKDPAEADGSTMAQLVSEALAALGSEDKLLLLLYYEQGLTLDQVGVAVRASKTALSRRLKRVREGLREAMESIARRRWGTSAEALRQGVDLSRVELDLERLLGGSAERSRPDAV
jgi:RNA polymerase sigma factor (sigma-70 family)